MWPEGDWGGADGSGQIEMTKTPTRRGPSDSRTVAEAAFKAATTRPIEPAPAPAPARAPSALPAARETVSLRIDRDVLEHFQADGPGWQERINLALRRAVGK